MAVARKPPNPNPGHSRVDGKFCDDPDRAAKEKQACDLRRDGLTFREIGERLECSEATACRLYQAVQQRTRAAAEEAVEDHVQTELDRLDKLIEKMTPLLDQPGREVRAAEVLEKLSASRRKLLGLDKPTKHEVSGPEGAPIPIDARASLLERLSGLIAGQPAGGAPSGSSVKPE